MQLYISLLSRRRRRVFFVLVLIVVITSDATTSFVSSFQSTGTSTSTSTSTTVVDRTTLSRTFAAALSTSQRRVPCAQQQQQQQQQQRSRVHSVTSACGYSSRPFLGTSTVLKVSTATDETTSTSSSKTTITANNPSISNENSKKKINHYDVLGATMTDTRDEIKRKYINLVKLYHPDALIGTTNNDSDDNTISGTTTTTTTTNNNIQFTQLTTAWKVLSNSRERKLYDRTLRIEKIGIDITNWAGTTLFSKEQSNDIATTSLTVLEQILVPFIRRTTATTIATVQAAVGSTSSTSTSGTGTGNNNQNDKIQQKKKFSLSAVAAAAIKANEYIDTIEREEHITYYTDKAKQCKQQSSILQKQLRNLIQQSLPLTLQLLNSNITSIEATMIIDRILLEKKNQQQQQNINQDDDDNDDKQIQRQKQQDQDDIIIIDTIRDAINELQNLEQVYEEYNTMESTIQEEYKYYIQQEQINEKLLKDAIDDEENARIAYIACKEKTYNQQQKLQSNIQNIILTKDIIQDNTNKINHHTTILQQQSEHVRIKLLDQTTLTNNNDNSGMVEELTYLRQREKELVNEINRFEYDAATLLSKANAKQS